MICQVMIKNIPNKMSDRHLIDFINDVCPRKIDFLYLRMCVSFLFSSRCRVRGADDLFVCRDFTNGCNVGYGKDSPSL